MRTSFATMFMTMALVLGLAHPGEAGSTMIANGTFTFTVVSEKLIGTFDGNQYIYAVGTVVYQGGLSGTATDKEIVIFHADGSSVGYGTEVCASCTLGSRSGAYSAVFSFTGTTDGTFSGPLRFIRGTGGLAGLRGGGPSTGDGFANNTYSFRYSFED